MNCQTFSIVCLSELILLTHNRELYSSLEVMSTVPQIRKISLYKIFIYKISPQKIFIAGIIEIFFDEIGVPHINIFTANYNLNNSSFLFSSIQLLQQQKIFDDQFLLIYGKACYSQCFLLVVAWVYLLTTKRSICSTRLSQNKHCL